RLPRLRSDVVREPVPLRVAHRPARDLVRTRRAWTDAGQVEEVADASRVRVRADRLRRALGEDRGRRRRCRDWRAAGVEDLGLRERRGVAGEDVALARVDLDALLVALEARGSLPRRHGR